MKPFIPSGLLIILSIPLLLSPPLIAAGGPGQGDKPAQIVCGAGQVISGDLGYSGTECHGCEISGKHIQGEPDILFDSEPILSDIRSGGPADGKLQEQDVLVAVDNKSITTREAAIRLSWLEPGKPVRLTVRRNGELREVEIVPTPRCRRVTQQHPRFIIIKRQNPL